MFQDKSGEGNENREKTTIDLISKKATLYISLPLFCTTTTWNFQKLVTRFLDEMSYVFLFNFFFVAAAHFQLDGR